ncbi:MAG: endolytic transglycosylase MltG [Lachnospiraceae bacterium]|nr:endolytic transglycosylase MltG [Lachnospiraceae bacterium]
MVKVIKMILLGVAVFALSVVTYNYVKDYYDAYMVEYKGTEHREGVDIVVEIPEGASANQIAEILQKKGLIKYKTAFVRRLQKSDDYRGRLSSGTYTLNTGMNTLEMMDVLAPAKDTNEPIKKLVVPEGYTIEMIAETCESEGICSSSDFLNAVNSVTANDFPYLADVPAGANVEYKLQGYLFPATYDIYEDTTATSLVEWMLETFDNYYSDEIKAKAEELGYSSFELLTRASIIEREAKVQKERATIAGVINNRLASDMKLQMCPTVLYPITKGLYDKEQVLYEDLEIDSPYNTYINSGLPVGPICNPGLQCIMAVLNPEEHSYFYYHVDDEAAGTHIFTETYEEHEDSRIIGGPDDESDDEESEE